MLHERGLEVGRIILTPQGSSISNKSLSDLMRTQSGSSREQPGSESRDDKVRKNNPVGVKEISGLKSSNEGGSTDKKTDKLDPKLLEGMALQKGLMQKPEKNSQENSRGPLINGVIQRNQAEPEKFSKPGAQATINTNNPVFESFEKQLNSRLALVNSTISGQKSTGIGALSEKVAEPTGKKPLKQEQTQAYQIKVQDSQSPPELDLAIKKNGELKRYLESSSKHAVDQITNKLVKPLFENFRKDFDSRRSNRPFQRCRELTMSNTKPSILVQEVQQLTAKEIAAAQILRLKAARPFERSPPVQQVQQNQLENVIQKFSEVLGSRMINAYNKTIELQLKLNPSLGRSMWH